MLSLNNSFFRRHRPRTSYRIPSYLLLNALMYEYPEWIFYLHPDTYLQRYPIAATQISIHEAMSVHPYALFSMMLKDPEIYYEMQLQVYNVYRARVLAELPKYYFSIPSEVLDQFMSDRG